MSTTMADGAAGAVPTCRCGHHRTHTMVTAQGRYSQLAWFANLVGVSARPHRVDYVCRRCGETFDSSTEPEVLAKHCHH